MARNQYTQRSGLQRGRTRVWVCTALCVFASSIATAQTPEPITDPDILAFIASLDENGIPPGHKLVEGDIIVPDDQTIAGTYAPNLWPNGRVA